LQTPQYVSEMEEQFLTPQYVSEMEEQFLTPQYVSEMEEQFLSALTLRSVIPIVFIQYKIIKCIK